MTNASVEKKLKERKNTKNDSYTEVNIITKKMI